MDSSTNIQPSAPFDFELDKSPACLHQLRRFSCYFEKDQLLDHISLDEETLKTIGNCSPSHKEYCRCSFSFLHCDKQRSTENNTAYCDTKYRRRRSVTTSGHNLFSSGDVREENDCSVGSCDKTYGYGTSVGTKRTAKADIGMSSEKSKMNQVKVGDHIKENKKVARKRRLIKGLFSAAWVVLFPVMVVAILARGSPGYDDEEDKHNDPLMPWSYKVNYTKQ